MGLDSSVALGSDTIIVDMGNDLATSVSSVTSAPSDDAALKAQDVSSTIFVPANDPLYQDKSNRELSTECLSAQESDQTGEEGSGLVVPKTRPQRHWPISVVRLLQNEETTEAESSPDPKTRDESSEDTTSEKSSVGSISEEETAQNSRLCGVSSNSSEESSVGSSSEEETAQNSRLWRVSSNKNVSRRTKQLLVIHQEQKQLRLLGRLQKLDCVSVPALLIPKSRYCGWKHSLPVIDERSALSRILQLKAESEVAPPNFHDILIDDFVIYRPGSRTYYPWQMVTLGSIISSREGCKYLINGALRCGGTTQYVEAAEIDIGAISVDGFEDYDIHSVQSMVYLQTVVCARKRYKVKEFWYRLGEPSEQYQVLYNKFLWVADLAKHVVDYLHWRGGLDGGSSMVRLKDFQHDFVKQLMEWHAGDAQFQKWMQTYNQSDFRSAINRHREFVFSRAFNLAGHYLKHDLWSELMVRPVSSIADKNRPPEDTLVTPYVRYCCKSMPWSYALRSKRMSESVQNEHERRASAMGFPIPSVDRRLSGMTDKVAKSAALLESAAKSASVIAIEAEEALGRFAIIRMRQSDGSSSGEQFSYVYIQGIIKRQRVSELKIIFVYLPSDTICLDGYYPRGDELFLSECCNCSANSEPILLTDIVRLVGVAFGDEADGLEDFFVRQKYVYAENTICRLKESDFQCPCRRPIFSGSMDKVGREEREPLSGLGLFAGCGNFDLGLETSGAIKFVAAVEINETSLKTYATNRSQGLAGLILDSVNPCLSQIFEGSADLPGIGSIDFISAGSPCPGFSRVNSRRGEDKGMRNCSLVASTVSYIETYLPKYAILENVGAMGSGVGNSGNQVIACLVGLGYQIRRMELNSRNYKSAQNRNRLFIVAAAPNVSLPREPKSTSTAATGFTRASVVSEHLPCMDNDDSICISHPDHVPGAKQTPMLRELIRRVPRYPKKMNFLKSIEERCQGEAQLEWFWSRKSLHKVKNHMAYSRLDPDGLIPTITTGPRPSCGFGGGRIIHWDEHRTLTLLEARRAQGFADDEVIIGDLPKQWAQVGNAVNRQVAAALGEVVAESWFSGSSLFSQRLLLASLAAVTPATGTKHDDLAVYSSTGTTLLSEQIQKETEALIEEDHDVLEQATSNGDDFQGDAGLGTECDLVSLSAGDTEVDLEEAAKSSTPALHRESQSQSLGAPDNVFGPKRLLSEESEFLKIIFRPFTTDAIPNNANGEKLRLRDDFPDLPFNQMQRRKMFTTERSAVGGRKSVRFTSERSIEVRTKTPSSAAIEHGSAEHPIEVEAEVTISKRRREERHSGDRDGDDDDDELKHWVVKRVRSRLDD